MTRFLTLLTMVLALLSFQAPVQAQGLAARSIGQERAPVVIDEYISLTCPHCGEYFLNTLPELEKRYVKTGKVRIVLHDYPLDGTSLKAAALARCMPPESYFPFIRILYENQQKWATQGNPEKTLIQYARLGGLDEDRARFCLNDPGMQNAILAERAQADEQYQVSSTPTFIFNKGVEKMEGASNINGFATIIDRMLARRK